MLNESSWKHILSHHLHWFGTNFTEIAPPKGPSNDALTSHLHYLFHHLTNSSVEIVFVWIPSHCGIPGNDMIDAAAKVDTESFTPLIEPKDLKKYIHYLIQAQWNSEWNSYVGKLRQIKNDTLDWTRIIGGTCPNWSLETAVNRIYLGHTRITYEYIFQRNPSPICEECLTPLIVQHITEDCRRYSHHHGKSSTSLILLPS